jgi:hypothetical protein
MTDSPQGPKKAAPAIQVGAGVQGRSVLSGGRGEAERGDGPAAAAAEASAAAALNAAAAAAAAAFAAAAGRLRAGRRAPCASAGCYGRAAQDGPGRREAGGCGYIGAYGA